MQPGKSPKAFVSPDSDARFSLQRETLSKRQELAYHLEQVMADVGSTDSAPFCFWVIFVARSDKQVLVSLDFKPTFHWAGRWRNTTAMCRVRSSDRIPAGAGNRTTDTWFGVMGLVRGEAAWLWLGSS